MPKTMPSRIMYIERKAGEIVGEGRIGRARFNRTGRTIFYRNLVLRRIVGGGFKWNYRDESTGDEYWVTGPKKRGGDRLYGSESPIDIDDDVREDYWTEIRNRPDLVNEHKA